MIPQTQLTKDMPCLPILGAETSLRVMLIDDDAFQRTVIGRTLSKTLKMDVVEAADGRQALDLIADDPTGFDLIVCDLDMPVMDGLAFIRHLGPIAGQARLLLLSGCDTSLLGSALAMCRAYGVEPLGALQKPVSALALAPLLEQLEPKQSNAPASRPQRPEPALDEILAAARKDEFEAHFQPKACASSGRIVSAEALARWRHPRFGVLPPYPYFIGQLERSGNIGEITDVMLRQAAGACREWQEHGQDLSVSVNLSQRLLQEDLGLAERISEIADHAGLHPSRLILEVTETAAATDIGPILENLARLRMRGFELSIDDFGTGYSSLEQLSRVAFTELKIDRSFVCQMLARSDSRTIIASSIDMARSLGIRTVAEGVESEAEWALLKQLGCDEIQGHLMGRPMPAKEFLHFVRDSNR